MSKKSIWKVSLLWCLFFVAFTLNIQQVSAADTTKPTVKAEYSVLNQKATIQVKANDKESGIKKIAYISGILKDTESKKWDSSAKGLSLDNPVFTTTKDGNFSIYVEDMAGNKNVTTIHVMLEMRAVWISYLEFDEYRKNNKNNINEASFIEYVNEIFDTCVDMNLNTVIVQVRPFGDALYPSDYFPWSHNISGTQGKNPGFDPLRILVEAAHDRDLEFHAWLNPYRVSSGNSLTALSNDNQAKKWAKSSSTSKKRNVLSEGGKLYYNPSKNDVQTLIVNGVKEIIENYDVDGIHLDDYFYPNLGSKYATKFDAEEYKTYVNNCSSKGTKAKDIVTWRRTNVNNLVKKLYTAIKDYDSSITFGISPQGNINNLYSKMANYVDVKTWLSSSNYIDYICPQIYWSFEYTPNTYAFDTVLQSWIDIRTSPTVKIYTGLAAYKAGSSKTSSAVVNSSGKVIDAGWIKSTDQIAQQIEYGRETGEVDGIALYRYDFLVSDKLQEEIENIKVLFE